MTAKAIVRTCLVCGTKFQRISHGKYCNRKCTKLAGRTKSKVGKEGDNRKAVLNKCQNCNQMYSTLNSASIHCASCRTFKTQQEMILSTPACSTRKRGQRLACDSCQHWTPHPGAELGYSCQIHFWMRCKPYLPNAKPWSPKE